MDEKPRKRPSNFWWNALDVVRQITDRGVDLIRAIVGVFRW